MTKLTVEKVRSADDRSLPVFAEFEEVADRIRQRAYKLFAKRGFGDGYELEDWLDAERQICWPSSELVEEDDEFKLKVALAGFDKEDIIVTAAPGELIIKATHEVEREDDEKDKATTVHWSEFRGNDVYRRFVLPTEIDVGKVSAEYKRGILTIEVPKVAKRKKSPRKVEISTAA